MESNEFLLVLNKLGFTTLGGGPVGGVIRYGHRLKKDTVVSLRLHPMDGRVLDWKITKSGDVISSGQESKELLRALQDKEGSGKFRKMSFKGDTPFRKITASMYEDLDDYDNNIERAISEIFKLDEQVVKDLVNKMKFEEYLNLAMALDQENISLAEKILQKYGVKPREIKTYSEPPRPTPESVTEHINYLTRNNEDNIVTPDFRRLKISEQKDVLNKLLVSQLQKMLANLRGYAEPGMYESALFSPILKDEIILKSGLQVIFQSDHHLEEAVPNAPNKPNNAGSDTRLEKDAEVAVIGPTGDTEDATVVTDTGNAVTVQTKTGRKTVQKDKVMQPVVDENAIDIKRFKELAGIKAQPIQKQVEEEEINEEDDSLGTNYTLEIDGEDVKKNDDPKDLITYAGEHGEGLEWSVYDTETGDVAATWDGTGFLQDAAKSTSHRQGKVSGWEREEEVRRAPEFVFRNPPDDEWDQDWL